MPDRVGLSEARLIEERSAWSSQFAGGMVEFDNAYFAALERGATDAEATGAGARALLDAYTERLRKVCRGEAANREAQAPLPASVSATPEGSQRGQNDPTSDPTGTENPSADRRSA